MNANEVVKMKCIWVTNKKNDGSDYTKAVTILKDGEADVWCDLKFGESVNDKILRKEGNSIITAKVSDVRLPISYAPYQNKEGKMRYPYVWVENIVKVDKMVYKSNQETKPVTQSAFSMDDESTDAISVANDSNELPNFNQN